MEQINRNYGEAEKKNKSLSEEIEQNEKVAEELDEKVEEAKSQLQEMKSEAAKKEVEKEEYSAKISQLIALEKRLQTKISSYERRLNESHQNEPAKNPEDGDPNTDSE